MSFWEWLCRSVYTLHSQLSSVPNWLLGLNSAAACSERLRLNTGRGQSKVHQSGFALPLSLWQLLCPACGLLWLSARLLPWFLAIVHLVTLLRLHFSHSLVCRLVGEGVELRSALVHICSGSLCLTVCCHANGPGMKLCALFRHPSLV